MHTLLVVLLLSGRTADVSTRLFVAEALSLDSRDRVTQAGRPVGARTAYGLIGRPDLAKRVHSREIGKRIATGVGWSAVTVGLVWGLLDGITAVLDNGIHRAVNLCDTMEMDARCADRSHGNWIPWTIAAGGAMAILTAAVIPADPLDRKAKSVLVDDHNRRLRAGMGLSGALETVERTANVRIAAVPAGQSGMLVAGCSF